MSRPIFTFIGYDRADNEVEYSLPAKFEVCSRCHGTGSHVNPSIDGNGISPEEFDEDPDFEESYFRGDYDVCCEKCHGTRVVSVADLSRCTFAQKRALVRKRRADDEAHRDWMSEASLRRAESGERW